MGTNYYWCEKEDCKECGRPFEPVHIGKSSGGWCFSLHVIPEEGINTLDDWKEFWNRAGSFIKDEYGESISVDEMLEIITNRSWKQKGDLEHDWYKMNSAIPGPNGLARANGRYCVGHGDGTWDYITGEFS